MTIVVEVLSAAIKEFIIRLVWFSDTDAQNAVVEELPTATLTEQARKRDCRNGIYRDSFIACTQSFYDAYYMYLQGKELEATYENLINAKKVLTFSARPFIPLPIWDEMINEYENNGIRLNNPHRTLETGKPLRCEVEALSRYFLGRDVGGCSNCLSDACKELLFYKIERAACRFELRRGKPLYDVNGDVSKITHAGKYY